MFKFQKLKSVLTEDYKNQIDVTCPHCGQVTSFSYSEKLPDQNQIICKNCTADIKGEFFSLLLKKEINSLEELKVYMLKLMIFAAVLSLLIGVYLYFKRGSVLGYFMLAIPVIVVFVTAFKYFQVRKKITELQQLSDKFGLS